MDDERSATVPPEARGLRRDEVRLLVADGNAVHHARFHDLGRFLRTGDLVVVNDSATVPAAVDGGRPGIGAVTVHFSTALDDGSWAVELRPPGRAKGPVDDAFPGQRVRLPGEAALTLLESWPRPGVGDSRLWRVEVEGARDVRRLLRAHGRPITYAYVRGRWPLDDYQTVFARRQGSAEMPSAGRPFSQELVAALRADGIGFATITLHTGVSSLEPGEGPLPEPFEVPRATAERVNATRAAGGRVIAVGTTVTRALETASHADRSVSAASGWTDLVLGPDRPARAVDGIVTGWHAPGASHLDLLEAVAGPETVRGAYEHALAGDYLWHEMGDGCLLFARAATAAAPPRRPRGP